uniref:Alkylated DNA repair protein AlkB homologue 8 N-terminal domain-containing protein n=1 Tax=Knipowitschia caucasica TaxID=637954 RepID=A0AAV2JP68_KNICA
MIVDFRKSTVPPPPPSVMDSPITSVESFRFLGTTITQDLKWEPTISSLIKKAQQRMYFLRQLRKAKLPAQMLVQFYTAIIESILTSSITVWFAGATVRDKQRLQRIVRSAEEVIGRSLPSLQDLSFPSLRQNSRLESFMMKSIVFMIALVQRGGVAFEAAAEEQPSLLHLHDTLEHDSVGCVRRQRQTSSTQVLSLQVLIRAVKRLFEGLYKENSVRTTRPSALLSSQDTAAPHPPPPAVPGHTEAQAEGQCGRLMGSC